MIRNFNVHFLSTNRTTGEKISKEIVMKNRIYQEDLIGIYKILHPMAEEYTSFLKFSQKFSQILSNIHKDRLYLGPKNNIKTFKIIEIIQMYYVGLMESS